MSVAQVTLILAAANIALVVVTYLYLRTVGKQLKQSQMAMQQSQIAMIKGIRYRLESDVTQIRVMKAQIIPDKAEGMKILEAREEQCSETIKELAGRIEGLEKRFKL